MNPEVLLSKDNEIPEKEGTPAGDDETWFDWLDNTVTKPAYNAGLVTPFNTCANAINLIAPDSVTKAKLAEIKPTGLLSDELVSTASSAIGSAVPFVIAGKLGGLTLRTAANRLPVQFVTLRAASMNVSGMVLGAAFMDGFRDLRPGETTAGNIAGSVTAFGAYGFLNSKVPTNLLLAEKVIPYAAIGAFGAKSQLIVSKVVSGEPIEARDLGRAALHGAITNLVIPPVSYGIGKLSSKITFPTEAVTNATHAIFGKPEPPTQPGETAYEIAAALKLTQPTLTPQQEALCTGKIIQPLTSDRRGSMSHEKYRTTLELPDGSQQPVIVRAFTGFLFKHDRFRHEQAAYHLNPLMRLSNGFPTTALRVVEINGKPTRTWVQEELGTPLEYALPSLAKARYGDGGVRSLQRLIREDLQLRGQLEQAFTERAALNAHDPNSHNLVLLPEGLVRNLDFDSAFGSDRQPHITNSEAYGVSYTILREFSGQPLSPGLRNHMLSFYQNYASSHGQQQIMEFGLTAGETHAMMMRTRSLILDGFPEVRDLGIM